MAYPCVACGFLVFDEPLGSYSICPICGWEDDHVQARYPASSVGANHLSLYDYQRTIALAKAPLEIVLMDGFRRHAGWRPLHIAELLAPIDEPQTGRAYFEAAAEDSPRYYWEAPDAPAS